MQFNWGLRFSSRMVAFSALLSLFLTREALDWITVPAMIFVLLGILSQRLARPVLGKKTLAALSAAALGFAVLDFLYIGGSLIVAGADFLVLLLFLKLLSIKEYKDYVQTYVISFFLLLSSTALSTEFSFLFSFILFFISLAWAMTLLTMKGESEAVTGKEPEWKMSRKFFVSTALLTLGSTAFTLAIFLVIPRVGIGYFSKRAGGLLKISGFSDKVELGSMGQVLLDPTAVMRVQFDGNIPQSELYFRGRTFDYYNGSSWEDRSSAKRIIQRGIGLSFLIKSGGPAPIKCVSQRIMLEPMESQTIFALYPPYEIKGDFKGIIADSSDALSLVNSPGGRINYTACSIILPSRKKSFLQDERETGDELQLPDDMEEVRSLAGTVARRADSPLKKALKIQDYLQANYSYSLDPGGKKDDDPINSFLFRTKKGYCEHFATAMVLLLRASGVPARLVSGFHGGEWNQYGGYYLVRAQDAHTWVEVFIPNSGWTRFDPTPPAPMKEKGILFGAGSLIDYLRFKWDRYIVFYSLRDQAGMANTLVNYIGKLRAGLDAFNFHGGLFKAKKSAGEAGGAGRKAAGAAAGLLAAAGLGTVYLLRKKSWAAGVNNAPGFYGKMLKVLKKKGFKKAVSQTPLEFAEGLKQNGPSYAEALYITGLYNRARFGGIGLNREEMERVEAALTALKSAPPHQK